MSNKKDYWNAYWNSRSTNEGNSPHLDVGRTINRVPIKKGEWNKTLDYIYKKLNLKSKDTVLDLCAGNGIISKEISKRCSKVTSVDFSKRLLEQIDVEEFKNIDVILADARKVGFDNNYFDKIIFYFSIQHFTKAEVVSLFRNFYSWLKPGGILFVGDIPNSQKMWDFFNTDERKEVYFNSLESNAPIIGTWFDKLFFENLSSNLGFGKFVSLDQPNYQINSHYRFDFISQKI